MSDQVQSVFPEACLPTHIDVALLFQHGPDLRPALPQEVLYIHLLCLVPRERYVQLAQHSITTVTLQLLFVDIVLILVTAAEEQDRLA